MPVSREGFEYEHVLFKPIPEVVGGGCHADVFLPKDKQGPYPVAVAWHPGGFALGGAQFIFAGHVEYLLERGYAVVGLEYRLAPHVRFDAIREDFADGYQWVVEELPKLENIDPSRVFVIGSSAGGTATLVATIDAKKRGLPLPKAIYCAYLLVDPTPPLAGLKEAKTYEEALETATVEQRAMFAELFAEPAITSHDILTDPPTNPSKRFTWASFLIRSGSINDFLGIQGDPGYHTTIDKDWPPTVIISAGADVIINPKEHAEVLFAKLQEEGVESKLLTCEGMDHGGIEPQLEQTRHQWWDQCVEALEFCLEKTK